MDNEGIPDKHMRGVLFAMRDRTTRARIRVLATYEGIADIKHPPTFDYVGALKRFDEYREVIEQAASDKYDKGQLESEGLVRVGAADIHRGLNT